MATFSQSRMQQLYVATALKTGALAVSDTLGTVRPHADSAKTHFYVQQVGAGGIVRSDLVDLTKIKSAKATSSAKQAYAYRLFNLSLDPNVGLITGQDYLVRMMIDQYIGMSDEDKYYKDAIVHAYANMTTDSFYTALYNSLVMSLSREEYPICTLALASNNASATMVTNTGITVTAKSNLLTGNSLKFAIASVTATTAGVTVVTTSGITTITASLTSATATIGGLITLISGNTAANALITITGTSATAVTVEATAVALTGGGITGITFQEVAQDWILGRKQFKVSPFHILPQYVQTSVDSVIWGTVTELSPVLYEQNGKKIADLEYFCMGNRGDDYRMMGFPYVINTKYLADPTTKYDCLDICFYYEGEGTSVQKSEKTLTLVAIDDGSHTLMNSIIAAINTAASTTIATL